ncbi:zinc ribbon domain-containing protein [Natrinema thermotolerans]|uniref:Zinc ribbon domain-containing protein n=1 Tax=Natrinema thermotolerans TaxID=121872 RepID=A0AAF0PEN9_9EURY|nr:zinc ribbon domain-containing protein [Natrinema thermotolerans]QCC57993.1 zinc ribbon domain-containing protein [Natrinema thermotolerans]WMT09089.1 zinc ribbon domain-containing protein [Natrinema thermotolerans]
MPKSISQKRPWLAALLAALATGLGHLYLRRLRRALGWIVVSFGVSAAFVDPAAIDTLLAGNGTTETLLAVAPMLLVVGLSTVDAYLLAYTQQTRTTPSPSSETETTDCPHCGNELDPDLEFCHWCTRAVENADRESTPEDR